MLPAEYETMLLRQIVSTRSDAGTIRSVFLANGNVRGSDDKRCIPERIGKLHANPPPTEAGANHHAHSLIFECFGNLPIGEGGRLRVAARTLRASRQSPGREPGTARSPKW